ncbi:MAG TPA: hypothetical protein HA271_08850 [Methanobacterium subterraneum]|uniref:Uncharacterized protein n=2 Tax=Methanobacterium subterraneum TaxID=59277 RepID=A0A7J4TKG7_9EURY|nr:hypothetical protein [Methanobacterium subterraneum]
MDVEEMAKKATMKDLKAIAKKHDIKLGRCPTKLKIAQLIPKDELEALVTKDKSFYKRALHFFFYIMAIF